MIIQVAEAIAQSQAGRLKTFAVTSKTRLPGAPDLPTVDEAGLPGMYISFWHGLWMPRGVPKDILAQVNAAMVETLADPDVRTRLAAMHQEIPPREQQTPEGLAAYPEGRDREVVADHQGGGHQGAVTRAANRHGPFAAPTTCDAVPPRRISRSLAPPASRSGTPASGFHDATWRGQCAASRPDQPASTIADGNPSMRRRWHRVPTKRRCLLRRRCVSAG